MIKIIYLGKKTRRTIKIILITAESLHEPDIYADHRLCNFPSFHHGWMERKLLNSSINTVSVLLAVLLRFPLVAGM